MVEWLDLHIWTKGSSNILLSYTNGINHPSIKAIKHNFNITSKFLFQQVSVNDMKQVIKDFMSNKSASRDILINIWKCQLTFSVLANCTNKFFETGMFPDCLEEANNTPIFTKDDPLYIENYHPVGILPLLFKGATKLQAKFIFLSATKISENTTSTLNCYFLW